MEDINKLEIVVTLTFKDQDGIGLEPDEVFDAFCDEFVGSDVYPDDEDGESWRYSLMDATRVVS